MKPARLLAALLLLASAAPLRAEGDALANFPSRVHRFTLKNGLRALVVERPGLPTVSFAAYVRTGGADDEMGKSGLAHMFEHMLFKGTRTIGTTNYREEEKILTQIDDAEKALQVEADKREPRPERLKELQAKVDDLNQKEAKVLVEEEFWQIYERVGGRDLNASTGYDFTNYVISLPVNQLRLWAVMEADRLVNPVLREFYKERDVVREERRQRIESTPSGKLWEEFLAAAFMAHPYGRPVVGWDSDISRVTVPDAKVFFAKHYNVSRLVVAVVGGVKAEEVKELLEKHFGSIPGRPYEPSPIPVEPPQNGERRVEVFYDAEPTFIVGYHRPDMLHPDNVALMALESVLSEGRTSRFYSSIVEKKRIAVSAWAGASTPGDRFPSLFVVGGAPRAPHTVREVEKAMDEEIELIKKNGPTVEELEKVKTNLESGLIRSLSSNEGLAGQLAYYECLADDWNYLLKVLDATRKLTPADVQRVAKTYLIPSNRTVAELVTKK